MVENVERHLHEGKRRVQAAIDAARELVGPIIAMTITLAAVYAPIGIQGGLTGALFREFAFTLAGAVIVSGVVALTLSPMMGVEAAARRATASAASPAGSTAASTACAAPTRARSPARSRYRPVVLVAVGDRRAADRCRSTCSRSGSWRPPRIRASSSRSSRRRRTPRSIRRSCSPSRSTTSIESLPETASIFQLTFPTGGFGGMVTKPWSERTKTTAAAPDGGRSGRCRRSPASARSR